MCFPYLNACDKIDCGIPDNTHAQILHLGLLQPPDRAACRLPYPVVSGVDGIICFCVCGGGVLRRYHWLPWLVYIVIIISG